MNPNSIFSTTPESLQAEVQKRKWYHKIELAHGIVTPGMGFDVIWDNIRKVRAGLDYKGKRILDIGSFDGMWAFEAESLNASLVVATDCDMRFDNFFFCKQVLNSSVQPYYNVSPHNLVDRLDSVIRPWGSEPNDGKDYRFDIVQHLGTLYHLTDPMQSLLQTRAMLKPTGKILLETACVLDDENSYMLFNGRPQKGSDAPWARIYEDQTTWWAPTILCIRELLAAALFTVDAGSIQTIKNTEKIGRVCLTASAMPAEDAHPAHTKELFYDYRIPGAKFDNY